MTLLRANQVTRAAKRRASYPAGAHRDSARKREANEEFCRNRGHFPEQIFFQGFRCFFSRRKSHVPRRDLIPHGTLRNLPRR